ncbi:MAG TPA: hypothetical protein VJU58_04125, partial [Microbacterium sp.]|nr:hypothetical protein [Microbacterium sp.]
ELREPDPPDAPPLGRSDLDAALEAAARAREQAPANPLDDPACYPGGVVPGLQKHRQSARRDRDDADEHEDDDDE